MELDESYFWGRRPRKRGRGTEKIPVFGIMKRNGKIDTQIIRNSSCKEIKPITNKLIVKRSSIYTDKCKEYDRLVFNGYKHYRINHGKQQYSNCKGTLINGIENFGAMQSGDYLNSMVYPQKISICISKSVNSGIMRKMKSLKKC